MTAVLRRVALSALLLLSAACSSSPPLKQWYKPGGNYTTDEFVRDRTACTKRDVVDEDCLKARGWVPLSADEDTRPPMVGGPPPGRERYAPK